MKNKEFKNKQFSKLSEKKLKEGKQLNEMVIDLILDRKDGIKYTPEEFYREAMMYGDVADEITRAMDEGTEEDIKKALCKYVIDNKYNPKICNFINSVKWLEADLDEETDAEKLMAYKKAKHKDFGNDELNLKHLEIIRQMNDAVKSGDKKRYNQLLQQQNALMQEEKKSLPSIEEVEKDGELLDEFPVDESQTVSNAGEEAIWSYKDKKYSIITWNDRAEKHKDGQKQIKLLPLDLEEVLVEPKSGESEQDYVSRFMGTKRAKKDFPDQKQRLAVAYSKFRGAKGKKEAVEDSSQSEEFAVEIYQLGKFVKQVGVVKTYAEAKKLAEETFKKGLSDKYSAVNITTIFYEDGKEVGMETETFKGYGDDYKHISKDDVYDLKPGQKLIELKNDSVVYVMEEDNTPFSIWCSPSENLLRGWSFSYTDLAFPEEMEESKTMNVIKEKVERKFTLENQKTTTWMEYYKQMSPESTEEEIISLHGSSRQDMNDKASYSADVLLDGKKLFRLNCLLFSGIGEWTEYHIDTQSITSLGNKILYQSNFTFQSDDYDTHIEEGVETPEFDENSTVETMLTPFINALKNIKLKEAVEKDVDEVHVYQFPNSIQNFLPEFKRLCDEHNLNYLGKGHGFDSTDKSEPDFFVEGRLEDLEDMAQELEYQLHSDYLTPADEFNYEDILMESKKNKMLKNKKMIKEATQKQVDVMKKSFYEKTKDKNRKNWTKEEIIEDREISARQMIISILAYDGSPSASDKAFDELFERSIQDKYLGDFLRPETKYSYAPAISKERLKQLWDDMVKDFKKSDVGPAGEDTEGNSYNYVKFADESMKKPMKESLLKEGFKTEEATKFVKELTQKLFDDGAFFDLWVEDEAIRAQIEWGDWKHQHLYFKNKVQKFFDELDIEIDIESEVTEEDGTDAYSASYTITKR